MNCKPGDLAIIIGSSIYAGRLVEVLYPAPQRQYFTLPNGVKHNPILCDGVWVVKSLGSPFPHGKGSGMYGAGEDRHLRPLPPQQKMEEQTYELET